MRSSDEREFWFHPKGNRELNLKGREENRETEEKRLMEIGGAGEDRHTAGRERKGTENVPQTN